ncbi:MULTISPECIES: hypothetical protein [unclassified Microcoleus]|uniref:hypothetical protein n=1 Tax=unclassified Microcoleus TaxID=2642155 RepID=UPI002FD6E5AD
MKLLKSSDLQRNRGCTGLLANKDSGVAASWLRERAIAHSRSIAPTIRLSNACSRLSNSGLIQKLVSYY